MNEFSAKISLLALNVFNEIHQADAIAPHLVTHVSCRIGYPNFTGSPAFDLSNRAGIDSKFFGYIDCGTKLYLDPTPNSKVPNDLFIYSNLNFIINSGDVRRVTKSNDLVIPSIQVGIVKTLGRF